MPVPISDRKAFIEDLVDDFGRPLRVPPWLIKNVIGPLDGFQSWRRGPRLCVACAPLVGRMKRTRKDCYIPAHDDCDGVLGIKYIVVIISVPRQEGKSTGFAGYSISNLALSQNTSTLYLAAAESQAGRVFDQKWKGPINRSTSLKRQLQVLGEEIINEKRHNTFCYVPTSAKSIPGGSYRLLLIDEARDVPAEIAARLMASILAARGMECPHGHVTTSLPDGWTEDPPVDLPECSVCGTEMEEWHGAVVVASSAGKDAGWFYETVEAMTREPKPGAHLFNSTERLNPNKSPEASRVLEGSFGDVPSMRAIMNRELHNIFSRAGDEFLPSEAIKDITNKQLVNFEGCSEPCVAFLDCSRTTDLTSLVIVDGGADASFKKIRTVRIDVWDPAKSAGGRVRYTPNPLAPGGSIQEHLAMVMPRFPGILELHIDTTLLNEAQDLYTWCRSQPWGGKIRQYKGEALAKKLMWDALEARALAGRVALEIQDNERLVRELRRAAIKRTESGMMKVVDSDDGDRRGGLHRDVAMSLAGCCWIASKYFARGGAKKQGTRVVDVLNQSLALNARFRPIGAGMSRHDF